MRRQLGLLRSSHFVRDVATLVSGTITAQVVALAAAPILTRLYTPNDLGILALFGAVVAGVAIVASWRYDLAIALPKSEAEAANLLGLSCFIVVLMAGFVAAVLMIAGDRLIQALGTPELQPCLPLIPAAILAIGLYQPLVWWAARRRYYRQSAISQIFRSVGSAVAQIAFGIARSGPAGLIIGSIVGQLAAVGLLAVQLWRKDGPLIVASLNMREMWRLGRNQSAFPKFNMPSAILFAMTVTVLPPVLLTIHFGTATAGAYWLADRVCQMPAVVLGAAVWQVFYRKAAVQFTRGEGLLGILAKSTIGLVLMVAAPLLIAILYAPTLFGIVFGEEWAQAGIYSRWLAVLWLVNLICTPSTTLIPIYGYQRLLLVFDGITQVPRLGIIPAVSYVGDDDVTAIAMYAVAGAILHLCVLVFIFLHAWKHQVSLVRAAPAEA